MTWVTHTLMVKSTRHDLVMVSQWFSDCGPKVKKGNITFSVSNVVL